MKTILTFLLLTFLAPSLSAQEFAVGQVWGYKNRAQEADSTLTIVQIDNINDAEIVHISLDGLRISVNGPPSGIVEQVSHLPIEKSVLQASVGELLTTVRKLPPFEEGYEIWKAAFDSGEGGYFTISVAECVSYFEDVLNGTIQ